MIDRYSSSTLDRPFAIADQDITTTLPAHVDDADLAAASALYPNLTAFETSYTRAGRNEMTVFLACVRLRQITSRIQRLASVIGKHDKGDSPGHLQLLATGNVFCALDELLIALEDWRTSTPMLTSPKCLYERHEYFEFLHAREKLLLIRRVMEVVPKRKGVPPQHLLALSVRTAARGIELFSELFEENAITYTRSYFSFLFTAGLSIMLSVSVSDGSFDECIYAGSSSKMLMRCEDTLRGLGEKLPDAKPYVTVFEALHRNVAKSSYHKSNNSRRDATLTPTGAHHKTAGPLLGPRHRPSQVDPPLHVDRQDHSLHMPADDYVRAAFSMDAPGASWPQPGLINMEGNGIYVTDAGLERSDMLRGEMMSPDDYTMFPWASLTEDNPLWSMEAGLGEYAYGDAGFNMTLLH